MSQTENLVQFGVRVLDIEKQEWSILQVSVPCKPQPGPSDEYLIVENSKVQPNNNGHFIGNHYSQQELDAIHTYAISRYTIAMWEKALGHHINWAWGSTHLNIRLFESWIDAAFRRKEKAIIFGESGINGWLTCHAMDIVAHETCHAILEGLNPGIHLSSSYETRAVLESICDLTAIFLKVELIDKIYENSILQQPNYFSEFALGYNYKDASCLKGIRSALMASKLPQQQPSLYDYSFPFTNQIYLKWSASIKNGYKLSEAGIIWLKLIAQSLSVIDLEQKPSGLLKYIKEKSPDI